MVVYFHNSITYLLLKNPPTLRSLSQAKTFMQKFLILLVMPFVAAAEILKHGGTAAHEHNLIS